MAIAERREIEFDMQAVRSVLEWSPRAAQAFGLPPLTPTSVRGNPADNVVEVAYGDQTSPRVFMLRAEALGAILILYCNRAIPCGTMTLTGGLKSQGTRLSAGYLS